MEPIISALLKEEEISGVAAATGETHKTDGTAIASSVVDAALERIIRRSRVAPGRAARNNSPRKGIVNRSVPQGPVHVSDAEPISALFRAAAGRKPAGKKWLNLAALSLLTVGCAAGAFLGGVFLGRNGAQPPKPPGLLLQSTDFGGTMLIRWNHDAVQSVDNAVMFVNDGGRLINLRLNHAQLLSGQLRYRRKSASVTATMVARDLQAATSFVAHARRRRVTDPPYEMP